MKKNLFALFFVIAVSGIVYARLPEEWISTGIGGGGAMFSPSFSPHNTQELFVASDMSGLYHSTSSGDEWEIVDFRNFQASSRAVIRFTNDPAILYGIDYSKYNPVPVKSIDGGLSWLALESDPSSGGTVNLFVDHANANQLMIIDKCNVYISLDSGSSFNTVYSSGCNGSGLHVGGAFFAGDRIFLGTGDGLLVSLDGGDTFGLSDIAGLPESGKIVSFAGARHGDSVRLFALVRKENAWSGMNAKDVYQTHQDVYVLNWGKDSWQMMNSGLPANPSRLAYIDASYNNIETVYVAGETSDGFPNIYKSVDGGNTWEKVLKITNNENIATGWQGYHGDSHWWWGGGPVGFAVAPNDPNRVAWTDYGFCHLSDDGGISWKQTYVNRDDENPAGSSTPKGRKYHSNGLEVTSCWQLVWPERNTLWACFTDIRGILSEDGGESWSFDYTGHTDNTMYRVAIHPQTGVMYGATSTIHDLYQSTYLRDARIDSDYADGKIVYSADKGKNWKEMHDFNYPVFWLALDPTDNNTLFASVVNHTDGAGGIYVSNDIERGHLSIWRKLPDPPRTEGHPASVVVLDDGTIVCTYSGRMDDNGAFTPSSGVFAFDNATKTWSDVSHPDMYYWTKDIVVDPHDPDQNTWYVGVFSGWGGPANDLGGLFKTDDRGTSWSRIFTVHRVASCTIHPDDPDFMYVTTETNGLLYTDNLNSDNPVFRSVENYLFRHPEYVFFNPYDHDEVWVTSFGNGLRVGRASKTSGVNKKNDMKNNTIQLFNNYPNPFNSVTTISYSLKSDGFVELSVFNVLGQKINRLINGFQSVGMKNITWNGRNDKGSPVKSGVYIYQIKNDDFTVKGKMLFVN